MKISNIVLNENELLMVTGGHLCVCKDKSKGDYKIIESFDSKYECLIKCNNKNNDQLNDCNCFVAGVVGVYLQIS